MTRADVWVVEWVEAKNRSDGDKPKIAVYDRRADAEKAFKALAAKGWSVAGWNMMTGDNLG